MAQSLSSPVFMSYSRRDEEITRQIVEFLRAEGIRVWVDNEKLVPGTPIWEKEIEKAIKAAGAVVVVMSPDSKDSEWVRREISLADQFRKRIFPVLVRGDEETSISLRLITRQFVDIRENESAGLESLRLALIVYLEEVNSAQQTAREEDERLVRERSEGDAVERAATEAVAREISSDLEPRTLASHNSAQVMPWFTLGWAVAGAIGGFLYSDYSEIPGGAIGGVIGGLVTVTALRTAGHPSLQKNMLLAVLAWTFGGAIGWLIGWKLTEATGAGIGMALFAIIGLASTLGVDYILSNWRSIAVMTLAWAIGGGIGWSIAKWLIDDLSVVDYAPGWTLGMAIGWGIAGFVMGWQLMKRK